MSALVLSSDATQEISTLQRAQEEFMHGMKIGFIKATNSMNFSFFRDANFRVDRMNFEDIYPWFEKKFIEAFYRLCTIHVDGPLVIAEHGIFIDERRSAEIKRYILYPDEWAWIEAGKELWEALLEKISKSEKKLKAIRNSIIVITLGAGLSLGGYYYNQVLESRLESSRALCDDILSRSCPTNIEPDIYLQVQPLVPRTDITDWTPMYATYVRQTPEGSCKRLENKLILRPRYSRSEPILPQVVSYSESMKNCIK